MLFSFFIIRLISINQSNLRLRNYANIKIYQFNEFVNTSINIVLCQFLQTIRTKFFYAERSHGRTYDNGCFHILERDVFGFSDMTYETSRECIARTCWVKYFF